ncbi:MULTISPECIES: hypothetical protein [Burkholderia]|jgi:hypothetical protein|nr:MULTISPECIES: hypothetical protein [Burkholderia]MDI9688141.1 hypothetical protein [Burkholderia cenocepacia]
MNPITLVLSAAFVLAAFAIGAWGHRQQQGTGEFRMRGLLVSS